MDNQSTPIPKLKAPRSIFRSKRRESSSQPDEFTTSPINRNIGHTNRNLATERFTSPPRIQKSKSSLNPEGLYNWQAQGNNSRQGVVNGIPDVREACRWEAQGNNSRQEVANGVPDVREARRWEAQGNNSRQEVANGVGDVREACRWEAQGNNSKQGVIPKMGGAQSGSNKKQMSAPEQRRPGMNHDRVQRYSDCAGPAEGSQNRRVQFDWDEPPRGQDANVNFETSSDQGVPKTKLSDPPNISSPYVLKSSLLGRLKTEVEISRPKNQSRPTLIPSGMRIDNIAPNVMRQVSQPPRRPSNQNNRKREDERRQMSGSRTDKRKDEDEEDWDDWIQEKPTKVDFDLSKTPKNIEETIENGAKSVETATKSNFSSRNQEPSAEENLSAMAEEEWSKVALVPRTTQFSKKKQPKEKEIPSDDDWGDVDLDVAKVKKTDPKTSSSKKETLSDDLDVAKVKKIDPKTSSSNKEISSDDDWGDDDLDVPVVKIDTKKNCQCAKCDSFVDCSSWRERNILSRDFEQIEGIQPIPLLRTDADPGKEPKIMKVVSDSLIVHGEFIPKPVRTLERTFLREEIKRSLKEMRCTIPTKIQSYCWSACRRHMSCFVVGPHASGKTLGYLPAILNFLLERSTKVGNHPSGIILCPTQEVCDLTIKTIEDLLRFVEDQPKIEVLKKFIDLDSNYRGLIVTIPCLLETYLKSERFTLKYLSYFVLEHADLIFSQSKDECQNVFRILHEIEKSKSDSVQLILTSNEWTADLGCLLKKLYNTPLVCVDNYLEMACYSNVSFDCKSNTPDLKKFYVGDVLKKEYTTRKTVVFCEEGEIGDLEVFLRTQGVDTLRLSRDLIEDERHANEAVWYNQKCGQYKVLLCSDAVFAESEKIEDAQMIIHYSFPTKWKLFVERFRAFVEALDSPLENKEPKICKVITTQKKSDFEEKLFRRKARNLVSNIRLQF